MGLIRKTFSIGLTGGLIGYRSRVEKVERDIRQTAKATRQAAGASRQQNVLVERQNQLIEQQTEAIIRQQQQLIEQQAAAMRKQEEELRTLQGVNGVPSAGPAGDAELERGRRAAFGALSAHEESRRKLGEK
ncbi:hypothetical protein [Arthrobacter sp. TE12232]